MKLKILICSLLLSISTLAVSATPYAIPVDLQIVDIRSYTGSSTLGHFVNFNIINQGAGCPSSRDTGIYFLIAGSVDAYTMLLSAKIANKPVRILIRGYDECTGGTNLGHARIHEVILK